VFAVLPPAAQVALLPVAGAGAPGLTVAVSPLISLMKDQVDALKAAGVRQRSESSLMAGQSGPRLRGLHNGEFRLLYVAPDG